MGVGARGWGTPTCHGPAARRVGSSAQVCFLGGRTGRDPEGPRPGEGRGRQRPPANSCLRECSAPWKQACSDPRAPRASQSGCGVCARLVTVIAPARHMKPAKVSWITRSTPARVRANHRKRKDISPARMPSTPRRLVPPPRRAAPSFRGALCRGRTEVCLFPGDTCGTRTPLLSGTFRTSLRIGARSAAERDSRVRGQEEEEATLRVGGQAWGVCAGAAPGPSRLEWFGVAGRVPGMLSSPCALTARPAPSRPPPSPCPRVAVWVGGGPVRTGCRRTWGAASDMGPSVHDSPLTWALASGPWGGPCNGAPPPGWLSPWVLEWLLLRSRESRMEAASKDEPGVPRT